jgi:hypothetical protein
MRALVCSRCGPIVAILMRNALFSKRMNLLG